MAKKKKEPKVEKVFKKDGDQDAAENAEKKPEEATSDVDEFLGKEQPEDHLTEKQKKKLEKLDNVKNKISKILQSSNIEIIDENFGDEYEFDASGSGDGQSQQDYDSLKALFGDKDKSKKQELTLTIDDFDYSYIGQYLEEYDLMHMKNIKKVKIQKKHSPKVRKILIAAVLVVVIGVGAFLGFFFTRKTPVYLKAVSLNQSAREYYVGDIFDYTGLYFIAEYSDGQTETVKLTKEYLNNDLTTGRIEKTGEDNLDIQFVNNGTANLMFSYNGFNVEYVVTVLRKTSIGIHVLYSDEIFSISPNGFITSDMLKIFIDYGDYGKELVNFSSAYSVYVDGTKCTYSNDGYRVVGGTNSSSIIKIEESSSIYVYLDVAENYV